MLPWPGGIEAMQNGAFVIALAAALLYLAYPGADEGGKRAVIKTIPLTLFSIIAWLAGSPWLLILGLALSAVGDFALAFQGEKPFLAGLSAFFAAHVAYIALFVLESGSLKLTAEPWRMAVCLVLVIHASWMGGKLGRSVPAELRLPVFAYIVVISLMGVAAAAYGSLTSLAGAVLFAVSDTLLATGKFLIPENNDRQPPLKLGVWVTYIAAQVLILLAFTT